LRKEADFRYGLGRVREHAEAVAQAAGEEHQRRRLNLLLARLVENYRALLRGRRDLGFFSVAYQAMPQITPAAVLAPLYFPRQIGLGAVTPAAMASSQVQGAFQLFVTQFQEVTTYVVVVDRLIALWAATEPKVAGPAGVGPLPRAPGGAPGAAGSSAAPDGLV